MKRVALASTGLGAFREAARRGSEMLDAGGVVLEASEPGRFRVRIIQAGLSGNRNFYPDAALREGARLFEGARVIVKPDAEHLASRGRDPRAVLGRLSAVTFVAGPTGRDDGALEAVFDVLDQADPMIAKLREAIARDMRDLFGLSIDANATFKESNGVRRVIKFTRVNSVDLIVEPGAGGQVLDVLESADPDLAQQDRDMLRETLLKMLKKHRPTFLEGRDLDATTDAELEAALNEALAETSRRETPPAGVTRAEMDTAIQLVEARGSARVQVARSTLPAAAQTRVIELLEARGDFAEATVTAAITAEQTYLAPLVQAGRVAGLGPLSRIEVGETRAEKTQAMLEAFFDPAHKDHRHARSFKQCYISITGDQLVTGQLRECDQGLMREALGSTTFDDVLGDSITRRMVADYRVGTVYDVWRQLVTTTPVGDFRSQKRTRYGGYGDLPAVAEAGPYAALTSPTDEGAEYSVTKRGGTETITLEMIKNDDVGVISRIPISLSRAAKRTLSKFALDFLRLNPVIFDTVALFHATHGNLGTAALDATSLAAGRLAMLKQTEKNSLARLGIGPRNLWVPADLEESAVNLFRRNTNNDETFVQSLKPNVLPVWYWTDANDWCLSADPADIPTIEIGFLDGNEEPTLLVQDSPTSGSMFSNDQLTWKIRHIYGGNVLDFRGLYKSVVP